jgi:hypothetical protein
MKPADLERDEALLAQIDGLLELARLQVPGRRAAVPAKVVELVAQVRQRHLVDNPAVIGVDDGQGVRGLDAGALVQAGEVETSFCLSHMTKSFD